VGRKTHDATTIDHVPPSLAPRRPTPPRLFLVFPETKALFLPPIGEPVGRAWLASQGISDSEISSQHCSFVRAGQRFAIIDEQSRNGTFVEGERLARNESVTLTDGALIRIGRSVLVFRESPDRPDPAKPIGKLVGPWGLGAVRRALGTLHAQGVRNVLVHGETGTGKELVAEAAAVALRRGKRYGVVNTAALSSGIFEAHLFGWRRGAFTGSVDAGRGVFATYDGGAVFLDELGDLPLELQPKLLRLLENGEIQPVGSPERNKVDVAIIGATNRDLTAMVAAGTFRRDLLARFERQIHLPPLRDRIEDIYAIACAISTAKRAPLQADRVEVEAVERLLLHDWPSNVRELAAVVTGVEADGALTLRDVENALGAAPAARASALTAEAIRRALAESGGNQALAARALGVTRGKLLRALKRSPEPTG
jgi:hypothetical protein